MWEAIFFYTFAFVAVGSGLLMVLMKNPVVSAVYLIVTFFSIAALFVMLNAQLLAALQVIVYAGAIMVLFLFVIMLLNLNRTAFTSYKLFFTKLFSLILIALLLWTVANGIGEVASRAEQQTAPAVDSNYKFKPDPAQHSQDFAKILFTRYVYPFEIIAIMLLAGILGAVLMAKRRV